LRRIACVLHSLDLPNLRRRKKRAGWLCVLFIAEILTASAMQTYEDELDPRKMVRPYVATGA
jgi:Mg/Co/Ni transporter MgtE